MRAEITRAAACQGGTARAHFCPSSRAIYYASKGRHARLECDRKIGALTCHSNIHDASSIVDVTRFVGRANVMLFYYLGFPCEACAFLFFFFGIITVYKRLKRGLVVIPIVNSRDGESLAFPYRSSRPT